MEPPINTLTHLQTDYTGEDDGFQALLVHGHLNGDVGVGERSGGSDGAEKLRVRLSQRGWKRGRSFRQAAGSADLGGGGGYGGISGRVSSRQTWREKKGGGRQQ